MSRCLLSGKEITAFGAKDDENVDGVRTNIGPVHRDALGRYNDLIDKSRSDELRLRDPFDLRERHIRKRALKIIESVKA